MKKVGLILLTVLVFVAAVVGCGSVSAPAGTESSDPIIPQLLNGNFWVDQTGTISSDYLAQLNVESHEIEALGFQLGGAVFNNAASDGMTIATKFANDNKLGYGDKDNGIAVVLFLEKKGGDGNAPAISVAIGKGLESLLNDAKVGRFLDETYVPARKAGKWQEGLLSFVQKTKRYLVTPAADEFKEKPMDWTWILICLGLLLVAFLLDVLLFGGSVTGAVVGAALSGSSSSSGGGGGFGGGGASR